MELSDLVTQLRERLGEPVAAAWIDTELTNWLNEAVREISIRTECNEYLIELDVDENVYLVQFPPVAGTLVLPNGSSTFNGDLTHRVVRTHRCTWVDNEDQDSWADEAGYLAGDPGTGPHMEFPLTYSSVSGLDAQRGAGSQTAMGRPQYYSIWGQSGNTKIVLFPRPTQAGNLRVYFYGIPEVMVDDTDTDGLPLGWEHLILDYAEYRAKVRDQNPLWQEAKGSFEQHLEMFKRQFMRLDLNNDPIEVDANYWGSYGGWDAWY